MEPLWPAEGRKEKAPVKAHTLDERDTSMSKRGDNQTCSDPGEDKIQNQGNSDEIGMDWTYREYIA